jgi:phosphatidylglycerophosphatase A
MYYMNCGRIANVNSNPECHETFGHIGIGRLQRAFKNNNIECTSPSETIRCDACSETNTSKEKVNRRVSQDHSHLGIDEELDMNLYGLYPQSFGGAIMH